MKEETPIEFTYWDYINLFYKLLEVQNLEMKHTWMIRVDQGVVKKESPTWFLV